ncbi:mitochondrial amidoxime-reducing component 1-like [Argiope bruennichi]|uniref:Mitochondrial amidoxime-reducing component 1 like protein n=1 Tax=Argiope bruennichi TaxID=94029 RepID=A0A8T0FXE7_ARGBR|nr:mitochondrial amidoxime-reducing component 1-like [Argiope bruennichi]XP_055932175.1 mitochondrial amidoxime-reducing component 1-like [Argiope bruennichi]XP_055932176.1 mitochondrial amidoxime-reducing component 1-like [Argiope bruennichi]KAF8795376.1 Mitochondrial amidoxime-reducing component 1 like protein [Argiope bruennichi]
MSQNWKSIWIVAAVAVGVVGVLVWKKKKRSFVKVGTISKLYFFPVKSLKGINVTKGECTKLGFEVDGLLDRSFMLVNKEGVLVSQREGPSLALLNIQINGNILLISTPSGTQLKVEIKDSVSPSDKIIHCRVHTDGIDGVDCGDEAAAFFQTYLNMPDVRLVRHFPSLPKRKYLKNHPFADKLRKENPVGFQDLAPIHILSKSSVDDLNSRLEDNKISELNFRPNVLVDGCKPYEEDSWRYIKFQNGVLLSNLQMVTRCLLTTNDPATGILSQKEPLVTLRKYRIPKDPETVKNIGSLPCLGIGCGVWKTGEISVGDDIFADVGPQPIMAVK